MFEGKRILSVVLTEAEYRFLEGIARANNITASEVARQVVLDVIDTAENVRRDALAQARKKL